MTQWSQVEPFYSMWGEDLNFLTATNSRRECWRSQFWEKANITPSGSNDHSQNKKTSSGHQRHEKLVSPICASLPFCRNTSLPVLAPRMDISWIQTKGIQLGLSLSENDFHTRNHLHIDYLLKIKCIFLHINHVIITLPLQVNVLRNHLTTSLDILIQATFPPYFTLKDINFPLYSINSGHQEVVGTEYITQMCHSCVHVLYMLYSNMW